MEYLFHRGDIVDFIWKDGSLSQKEQNKRNDLQSSAPHKLIVLRPIDENNYLVVVCKNEDKKTHMKVETTAEPLYIKVLAFYSIDAACLLPCNDISFRENKFTLVERIYETHNLLVEKRKQAGLEKARAKRKAEAEKKNKKRNERAAQIALENKYIAAYENAVLNNDTKRMKEIESIVGYAPGRKGSSKGYGTRNGKVLYSNFNPRPCSGGRFTPK